MDGRDHLPISSYITRIEPHESGCSAKRHRLYAVPTFIDPIDIAVHGNHLFVGDTQYGSGGPAVVVMKEHSIRRVRPQAASCCLNRVSPGGSALLASADCARCRIT